MSTQEEKDVPTERAIEVMCASLDVLGDIGGDRFDKETDEMFDKINKLATFMLRYGSNAHVEVPGWMRD